MSQLYGSQKDWRSASVYTDSFSALDSLSSYDDFSGRAALYQSQAAASPLEIDLLVQNISFTLAEHIQVTPHIGNTFGAIAFGKAPMQATVSCALADPGTNFGKQYLVDAYKNRLRLEAVAKSGAVPVLRFENGMLRGPLLSLRVSEQSTQEDLVTVVFVLFVLSFSLVRGGNSIVFDYVHGTETVDIKTAEAESPDEEVFVKSTVMTG